MLRRAFVVAHRWLGLAAGLLLALLGLTGSLMVWQAELDAALNPGWSRPPPGPACRAAPAPVAEVLRLLAQHAPAARAAIVLAPPVPGAPYAVWESRDAGTALRREHFIDPDCGRYLGARVRGAWRLDRAHAVPLLYELHSRLLAGDTGHVVAGVGALLLLALSLSGIGLAWPRGGTAGWRRALGVKRGASAARLWFDLHRAGGLWLAPVALLLALTGAVLVFTPQARALVAAWLPTHGLPPAPGPLALAAEPLPIDALLQRAQAEFPHARWSRLTLPAAAGAAADVRLLQAGEPRVDTGNTRVRVDAVGRVQARYDPLQAPAGSVLLDWVFPLHSGEALGGPARLLWSVAGLLPAGLLASGAWLWWRRRRARRGVRPV